MALFKKLFKKKTETTEEVVASPEPVELKSAPFNLNDTLRDVANILSLDAQEKRISIVYRMKKNVPSSVIGDRYKLSRLLTDLIGNAIDFTDKREDVVVQINRNEENEESVELHFEVIDYGIGIAEETVENEIMPMLTGDKAAAAYGMRGSGLQRARDIVHAMLRILERRTLQRHPETRRRLPESRDDREHDQAPGRRRKSAGFRGLADLQALYAAGRV
ncbi:MAG: ATP-binding protein [Campylobacterales bacterium]